jgi:hypothetical protein
MHGARPRVRNGQVEAGGRWLAKRVTPKNGTSHHVEYAPLVLDGPRIKLVTRTAGQIVKLPETLALPAIERRRSPLHGWGVFALERITKNRRIIYYSGQLVPSKESHEREAAYLEKGCIWCFELSTRWAVDANFGGNVARFINHACKPNCYSQIIDGIIWIRAARTIQPGEELTYSYNTGGTAEIPCQCTPDCRSVI